MSFQDLFVNEAGINCILWVCGGEQQIPLSFKCAAMPPKYLHNSSIPVVDYSCHLCAKATHPAASLIFYCSRFWRLSILWVCGTYIVL